MGTYFCPFGELPQNRTFTSYGSFPQFNYFQMCWDYNPQNSQSMRKAL